MPDDGDETSPPPPPPPPPVCCSEYPEIRTDAERQEYKREFDVDLREYKRLCAEMDDINDRLNKLSRQLDTLDDTSPKYQVRRRLHSPRTSVFDGRQQMVINREPVMECETQRQFEKKMNRK